MSVRTRVGRFEQCKLSNDQSKLEYRVCTQFQVGITNRHWDTRSSVVPPPSSAFHAPTFVFLILNAAYGEFVKILTHLQIFRKLHFQLENVNVKLVDQIFNFLWLFSHVIKHYFLHCTTYFLSFVRIQLFIILCLSARLNALYQKKWLTGMLYQSWNVFIRFYRPIFYLAVHVHSLNSMTITEWLNSSMTKII